MPTQRCIAPSKKAAIASSLLERCAAQCGLRRIKSRNSGTPAIAVSAPTRNCRGANSVRAQTSATITTLPPRSAEPRSTQHERTPGQRRAGQHEAMIRAEHPANQMRRHQSDEADSAGSRHAGCSQDRTDDELAHAYPLEGRSKHARVQLAAREQIEMTCKREGQSERGSEDGEQRTGSA